MAQKPLDRVPLEERAILVREHVLRMSTDGGCFTGASLSCVDLLVYLYEHVLNIQSGSLRDSERDYLLLSKGHDVPALYGLFAEIGFLDPERLRDHLSVDDAIYWHPHPSIPGVEFHSGSLGHLLAVGIGIALDIKLRKGSNKVVVILGDGELNEGSVWEASLTAAAKRLDNLIVVVDRNHFQANVRTEELIPLHPIDEKFRAFGWNAVNVDGHSYDALHDVFSSVPSRSERPTAIIASTMRGKGVPSIEERADRWFCNFTHEEVGALIGELHGEHRTVLTSETLVVR
jgi:transketolase